ncbi:MAG: hypothetical protein DRJ03_11135 [Chloroflexi bacterium]|nr:MAG: hypothetical protein DRJ03_11135 [Chloroflexota bacterium]
MTIKRQKVLIEGGTIDISSDWNRELGQIDLARVLGAALSHSNPVIVRITDGSAFIDPRNIRQITETLQIRNLDYSQDSVKVYQDTHENLKALVKQLEKDRVISNITKVGTPKPIDLTWTAAGNQTVWTPASGKKVRVCIWSLELDSDVDLAFRFGDTGTLYYLRTKQGPYVCNLIGAYVEGGVDEALNLYASGPCTVKGFVVGEEI